MNFNDLLTITRLISSFNYLGPQVIKLCLVGEEKKKKSLSFFLLELKRVVQILTLFFLCVKRCIFVLFLCGS